MYFCIIIEYNLIINLNVLLFNKVCGSQQYFYLYDVGPVFTKGTYYSFYIIKQTIIYDNNFKQLL